jgi:hypothetical protein
MPEVQSLSVTLANASLERTSGGVSVLYVGDVETVVDFETSWACDLCGDFVDVVEYPAVMWQGDRVLLFHTGCASRLGVHLIADAREAELASSHEGRWRNRLIAAVRHRLVAEEQVAA